MNDKLSHDIEVLLVHLPLKGRSSYVLPIGLGIIASAIKEIGIDPKILDIAINNYTQFQVKKILRKKYDVFAISAFSAQFKYLEWITNCIKEYHPNSIIIVGGPLATSQYNLVLKYTKTDYCFVGEGEEGIKSFFKYPSHRMNIPGICFTSNGKIILNSKNKHLGLNKIPPVMYELFDVCKYMNSINSLDIFNGKTLNISIARGCISQCNYCAKTFSSYRVKKIEQIEKELLQLIEMGVENVLLSDELSIPSINYGYKLSNLMKKLHLGWTTSTRIDLVDCDLLEHMVKCNCHSASFGIESGSQTILNNMNKNLKLEEMRNKIRQIHKSGIQAYFNFIFGYPGENEKTIEETYNFCVSEKCFPPVIYKEKRCNLNLLIPYPGSKLYVEAKKNNLIKNEVEYTRKLDISYNHISNYEQIPLNLTKWSNEKLIQIKDELEKQLFLQWLRYN